MHVAKQDLSIWSIVKSRLRRKLSIDTIITRAKSLGIDIDKNTSKEIINANASRLNQEVHSIHKNSANKRDDMMHDNANYSEDVGDKDKAKRLRQQKKEESKNRVYTALKFIRGRMIDGCGITRLLVPALWPTSATYDATVKYDLKDPKKVKDESVYREVNCPKEIEFLLRLQNQRHFGQAKGNTVHHALDEENI